MPKTQLPIADGYYQSASLPISAQRCVNWYPSIPQGGAVTDANLFGTAGLTEAASASDINSTRGSITSAGIPYFVIGGQLYKLTKTVVDGADVFTPVALGAINGSGRVSIAENGNQVCVVVPSGDSYIWDQSDLALYTITDPSFDGPADTVSYVSGFFVFTTTSGKKFFNSPLNDGRGAGNGTGVAYDALDFSTAEADPDQIRSQIPLRNQLYIFGSETIQVFNNTGRTPAPFSPVNNFVIAKGISAPLSAIEFGGTFAFIGAGPNETPAVWVFDGNAARKISTTPIDNVLAQLTEDDLGQVFSWSYAKDGAYFVGFQLPSTCFVFDSTASLWHERESAKNDDSIPYRAASMVTAYGLVLVGDRIDGRIGVLSNDTYTEYGRLIKRTVTTRPFDNIGNPVFVPMIEAVMETGVGITGGVTVTLDNGVVAQVGDDPHMMLEFSDDGGRTFSNGRFRSLGKVGQYAKRLIWYRNGRFSRSRTLRFIFSAPVKPVFIKLEADIFSG